jgi:hypothetical protein
MGNVHQLSQKPDELNFGTEQLLKRQSPEAAADQGCLGSHRGVLPTVSQTGGVVRESSGKMWFDI